MEPKPPSESTPKKDRDLSVTLLNLQHATQCLAQRRHSAGV